MISHRHFRSLFLIGLFCLVFSSARGSLIYDAAFTTSEIGFTHTESSPPAAGPQSVAGPNYSFGYSGTLLTDTSPNFMVTSGGEFSTIDIGGEAFLRSSTIDISAFSLVDISGIGATVGSNVFNAASEDFNWFYSLDGSSDVAFGLTSSDGSLNSTLSSLNVDGSNQLTVGFRYNINGAGDGFNVTSLTVSAVPEPRLVAPLILIALLSLRLHFTRSSRHKQRLANAG